jgi:hypothetical protein
MKRTILLAVLAALTISLVATGAAFAQGYGPGGNNAGTGTNLSTYMPAAIADVLGLSVDQVASALASGETFTTLALSAGYSADQLPALMTAVRTTAIDLAVVDGVVTAEQADFLLTSQYGGNARGTSAGSSLGTGTSLCDGTCIPQNLSTLTGGSMRRAGGPR